MKRILALLISAVMTLGVSFTVNAADVYNIVLNDSITVFVNGNEMKTDTTVSEKDKVKLEAENGVVVIAVGGVYYPVGKEFKPVEDLDLTEAVTFTLGLSMVDGAQVRVGNVTVTDDGKLDNTTDSGLRFLATCNYADTIIADENVEFGIKITAEGSEEAAYIKAETFQNDDCTVFTAAVTNLAESNYNRNYTASAYAKVPMYDGSVAEFEAGEITRSIYQVSVGILKSSSAEFNENLPYTIDNAVKDVLTAYINHTGIRLSYSSDGTMSARLTGNGAYTGDLYFDVESSLNPDGSTFVTVTPLGESDRFFNSVTLPTWWMDYIRINNNNSVAVKYISDAKLEDGVLSFKFTLPGTIGYTFDQEESVTVVSEITKTDADGLEKNCIKGFKAGKEVTYILAETITVMGLAKTMKDVVPGSVIMVGYNQNNEVAAVELLASLGMPINPDTFEASFGVYAAGDGSTKYKNVVGKMTKKNAQKLTCQISPNATEVYEFDSLSVMCYRVGIAMKNNVPEITVADNIAMNPGFDTGKYNNYVYLRYNSEKEKITECVYYRVPIELDFSGDGEYSDIFSLDDYRVIIE